MGKRIQPIVMIEEPDFPEVGSIGSKFELPTDDEFMCSSDDVRQEWAMLGGGYEQRVE
ncbi:MAG TPA: hypothetical protein VHQ88_03180 [Burkholderiales bacterium]|jgi:hypothetical protein|nr:hypothetical protein [Burkholderiales bacterium]